MALARRPGRWWRRGLWGLAAALLAPVALAGFAELRYRERIVPADRAPEAPIALVFGAGLTRGGAPSPVLRQRLDRAIALYREGRVQKLLVSGDNTDRYHDETASMRRYLLQKGLPPGDVLGDDAGVSTYDSVFRARSVFGVGRAILVTQDFHLPRAVYVANALGIDAWGVPAEETPSRARRYGLRELFARAMAVPLVLWRPAPRFPAGEGGPSPVAG